MLPTNRAATQESPALCPVRSGVENAMAKHVLPFAGVLLLGSLVGFLAMLRAFLDGEVFDAGTMVSGDYRVAGAAAGNSSARASNGEGALAICSAGGAESRSDPTGHAQQALALICFWGLGLWILKRARVSSPRDRIKLLCGTLLLSSMLVLYSWEDAQELVEYQTVSCLNMCLCLYVTLSLANL